jgi:hypothetical protein
MIGRSTPSKNIDRKFESFEKHTVNLTFTAPDNSLVNYLVALAKEPQMVRVSSLTIRRPNNNPQILTGNISIVASFPKQKRELKGKYDRQSKGSPSTKHTKARLIQKEDRFQKKRVHDELRAEYKKLQREHDGLLLHDEEFRKKQEYDELRKKALECFYAVAVSLPSDMKLLTLNYNDRKESKQNLSVIGFVPTDLDQLVATFGDKLASFQVKDAVGNDVSLFEKVEEGSIVEIPIRGDPMKRWTLSCSLMVNREKQKEGRPFTPPRPPSGGRIDPVAKLTTKVPAQGKENTTSPPKPSTGALKSAVDQNKTTPATSPAVPSGSAVEGSPKPPKRPKFTEPMPGPLGGVDFGDIVRKNPFDLERPGDKPPPKIIVFRPAPAKPHVRLSGIMALGGKKKVYLEIKVPGAGATPLYHALAESESANGVKVLSIDPVKGEVKLDIKGEEVTRSFDEEEGKGEPFASNRSPSRGSTSRGSSSRGSSSRGSSSSRYNRPPTTPTRPPSGGGGSLKSVPTRGRRSDAESVKEREAKLPLVRLTSVLLLREKKMAYLEIRVPGAPSPLYHQLQESESANGVKVIRIDRNRVVIRFEAINEERTVTFPEDDPAKARPSSPPKTSPGRLETIPSRPSRRS